ncbi:hypothetical protein ACFRNJ_39755 [Streptomyces sp. NPDC056721]|uniref:hypothetical protein n=1 Tax=unclassified Streptomyces TaxID=2593676 RepID=UPI0036752BDC
MHDRAGVDEAPGTQKGPRRYCSLNETGVLHDASVEHPVTWIRQHPSYAAQPYEQLAA